MARSSLPRCRARAQPAPSAPSPCNWPTSSHTSPLAYWPSDRDRPAASRSPQGFRIGTRDVERSPDGAPARDLSAGAGAFYPPGAGGRSDAKWRFPSTKCCEQFASFQVRPDQVCEAAVPQMQTPFLQVTLEDSKRFGTSAVPRAAAGSRGAAAASARGRGGAGCARGARSRGWLLPRAPKVPPPAARGSGPPRKSEPIKPIRLTLPPRSKTGAHPLSLPKFHRTERVCPPLREFQPQVGRPFPPICPRPLHPPRRRCEIPFKVSPPSDDLRERPASKLPSLPPRGEAAGQTSGGPRVRLPLRNVLRGIPPFQISGPIDEVPQTAQIEFAFAIVQPQLSLGRIAVSPAQFLAALPEEFRSRFKLEEGETPVALPLHEVLQNLPARACSSAATRKRSRLAEIFETPFSKKAAEDAARMQTCPRSRSRKPMRPRQTPLSPGALTPAALSSRRSPSLLPRWLPRSPQPRRDRRSGFRSLPTCRGQRPDDRRAPARGASRSRSSIAKAIVADASRLPGVSACAVVFSDGLSLAGNIPAENEAEALCAHGALDHEANRRADQRSQSRIARRDYPLLRETRRELFRPRQHLPRRSPCRGRDRCRKFAHRLSCDRAGACDRSMPSPASLTPNEPPCPSSTTPAARFSSRSSITVPRSAARRPTSATSTNASVRPTGAISSRSRPPPIAPCSSIFCL